MQAPANMAPSLSDTWRSFWHAVTTNDRHASYNSPYKTGEHVPLPQSKNAPFPSATSAIDSRLDLQSPHDGANGHSPIAFPYSPGMRSAQRSGPSLDRNRSSSDSPVADIQMQSFNDGLPPPPPVEHSWSRIERWLEDNYQELFDNVCEPATHNDVNELELELDCTLPQDVRDSLQIHDGQERGGRPTGFVFGCMLLDCEEIVEEWRNWRAVNAQYLETQPAAHIQIPIQPVASSSAGSSSAGPQQTGEWKEKLLGKQDSQPPNSVQKAYAHVSWIPLVKDWGGNCIAVDLAPGPAGKWGQIIVFGRDYDCKYVVARSWAAFLASLADDFSSGSEKVLVDEENGDLRFQPFKKQGVEPPYLEVLRWRCDQRYGRKPPARSRASNGLRINSSVPPSPFDPHNSANSASPYASPISGGGDLRGRSPQRSNGKAPLVPSPMRTMISSPLARVAEEAHPAPLAVRTDSDTLKSLVNRPDKLVSIDTPRASGDFPAVRIGSGSGASTPTGLGIAKKSATMALAKESGRNDENKPPAPTSAPTFVSVGAKDDQSNPITPTTPTISSPSAPVVSPSSSVKKEVERIEKKESATTASPLTSPSSPTAAGAEVESKPTESKTLAEDSSVGELKTVEI